MRKILIAGNWKMNNTAAATDAFCRDFKAKGLEDHKVDMLLCPPYTSIAAMVNWLKDTPVAVGAENMHQADNGAYTGEISADMLIEAGCDYVLIGHSERRQYFSESDELVNTKVKKALEKGILPVMCIGETLEQRESNVTEDVVKKQITDGLAGLSVEDMEKVVVAYEPVWAIGTGLTATPEQAQAVHAFIRNILKDLFGEKTAESVRILYGGSAKLSNAEELLSEKDIDGLLIGGASLKTDDFYGIIEIADKLMIKGK